MAKTVRLTSTYNGNGPGSIVSVPDDIAAQLVANGNASLDLSGGIVAAPTPAAPPTAARVAVVSGGRVATLTDSMGTPLATMPINPALLNKPKKIIGIGDSLTQLGDKFGWFTAGATVLGTNYIVMSHMSQDTPAGTMTLEYKASAKAYRFTAATDTPGPWIVTTGPGYYELPSGNPAYYLVIGAKLFSPTDITDTFTRGAWQWQKNTGAYMHVFAALTGNRFQIMRNMAISGAYASDLDGNWMGQALATDADGIVVMAGTNDIHLRMALPEDIAGHIIAAWDQAKDTGKIIFALPIPPRWGLNADGSATIDSAAYTAQFQARRERTNMLLEAAAATRPWVRWVIRNDRMADATKTTGELKKGYGVVGDGLHFGGGAGYELGSGLAVAVNATWPGDPYTMNVGGGAAYSVDNPTGNILPSNTGSFVGTGTPGTGVTATPAWATATAVVQYDCVINGGNLYRAANAGTTGASAPTHIAGTASDGAVLWEFLSAGVTSGSPAGFTVTRGGTGATVKAFAHKVTATDGGPDWQEFALSGAGATTDSISMSGAAYVSRSLYTTGDKLAFSVQCMTLDGAAFHATADMVLEGPNLAAGAYQMRDVVQGMRSNEMFTLAIEDYIVQSTVTNINQRYTMRVLVGKCCRIRWRKADMHKVLT